MKAVATYHLTTEALELAYGSALQNDYDRMAGYVDQTCIASEQPELLLSLISQNMDACDQAT
jgi:hypothetical protein